MGCGTLVEGRYVATCRHVWEDAVESNKRLRAETPEAVEIEYPTSFVGNEPARHPAKLADPCDRIKPKPDLVFLSPADIPYRNTSVVKIAAKDELQVGDAYIVSGITGRIENAPHVITRALVEGRLLGSPGDVQERQFNGASPTGYWFEKGSSGSPVFTKACEHLAGILMRSEVGLNDARGGPQVAFVVPATAIRRHLIGHHIAPVLEKRNIPLDGEVAGEILGMMSRDEGPPSDMPSRLEKILQATAQQGAEPVAASNEGADIDAAIRSSHDRLKVFDTTGAIRILAEKVADEEIARTNRLMSLLKEKATIEQISFDHEAAKKTLTRITQLVPNDIESWLSLGDLWMKTGVGK